MSRDRYEVPLLDVSVRQGQTQGNSVTKRVVPIAEQHHQSLKPRQLARAFEAVVQTAQENCVSHNGSLIPHKGRDLFVQAWYQGGTSVIEFSDIANIREIAYYDRGPVNATSLVSGGHWSSYWYDGMVYGSEIARGFDVMKESVGSHAVVQPYLNAQTQERFVFRK